MNLNPLLQPPAALDQIRCASCGIEMKIDGAIDGSRRERKRLLKILFLKVRVVFEQFRAIRIGCEDFQYTSDGDSHSANTGLATHFAGLDRDPVEWRLEMHTTIMPPRDGPAPSTTPYCYHNAMGNIEFAWDRRKARSNLLKHAVSFEEAQTVFLDDSARLMDDPDHFEDEDRFLLLGYSFQARCLMVSHCYRQSDSVIRLISARRATLQEQEAYWRLK